MVLSSFDLSTVLLLPGNISLLTETELTQYFIKDWDLTFWNKGTDEIEVDILKAYLL